VIAGGGMSVSSARTTVLCVAKNSPIKAPKDFEGQAIGVVSLVSLSSSAVKVWLDDNHVDVAKVKIVEIPFPQMGGAIERGAVAGALITEPSLSAAAGDVRVFANPYDSIASSSSAAIGSRRTIGSRTTQTPHAASSAPSTIRRAGPTRTRAIR